MKILYYDCFSGISGDMNLGAMIDLGIDKEWLINELSKLNINGYTIEVYKDERKGITGTKVDVILEEHKNNNNEHIHHHGHEHIHKHHDKDEHTHNHIHERAHEHRNLKDIEKIINLSNLNDNVKKLSIKMFYKLAEAEGKVHGKPVDEVHFHEVGAVDSIVDIVGAAICLDYLKIDKVMASTVELGGGFVKCAHGTIPVPAPATVEILKGIPVKSGIVPFETTTPTGAVILASNVDEFTDNKNFIIDRIGYGIGGRDTDVPNVLRIFIGEIHEETKKKEENFDIVKQNILECNIDDMNPEMYEYIMSKLFEVGASDVYLTNIIMKKGRPAVKISILYYDEYEKSIEEIIFKETSTLGIRKYDVYKKMLRRESENITTQYGDIRVKKAYYNGSILKFKPEYEDCKRISQQQKIPISYIYKEIEKNASEVICSDL
jgi:uncharacterized protein (TIGR00299 family) protein